MSFEEKIKEWVAMDNQMKLYLEKIRELRTQRNDLTDLLTHYAHDNNLENAIVQISDGRLRFQKTKTTNPLTFKFIEECLLDCIEDPQYVKKIIQFIKERRTTRSNPDIKRFYNKNKLNL